MTEAAPIGAPPAPAEEAPPVVAVVVTRDPGPLLEEVLESLTAQDYPSLSVLVVDAASSEAVAPRVASVAPGAFVKRLERDPGYGAAANQVLNLVEGAAFFVFCHDDAAPRADAVRLMVECAYRNNAGAVTPKVVDWTSPDRLLAVGEGTDALGRLVPMVDAGELDQGQHDGEREVLAGPSAALLVRADLFQRLGGFDHTVDFGAEALDLCWRAAVAGARTWTAPAAVVLHAAGPGTDRETSPHGEPGALEARHRMRAALVAAGVRRFPLVLLAALGTALLDLVVAAVARPGRRPGRPARALAWNLRHMGSVLAARRRVARLRKVPDESVRRLLARGGSITRTVKLAAGASVDDRRSLGQVAREVLAGWRSGLLRSATTVTVLVLAVLSVGFRHLPGRLPRLNTIAPPGDDAVALLREYLAGARPTGMGGVGPAPPGVGLFGVLGTLTFGSTGAVWQILVLGAFAVGISGAARLARPVGSWRAGAVAAVAYAAVPVGYDALARGRMSGVVAYALAPWILARVLRASGLAPFGAQGAVEEATGTLALGQRRSRPRSSGQGASGHALAEVGAEHALDELGAFDDDVELDDLGRTRAARQGVEPHRLDPPALWVPTIRHQTIAFGLLVALAAALAPVMLVVPAVLLAGVAVWRPLTGRPGSWSGPWRVVGGGIAVALGLLLPWSVDLLRSLQWSALTGPAPVAEASPSALDLVRFSLGRLPVGPLPLLVLVAAALPVAIGKSWRPAWAVRLWAVAVGVWTVTFLLGRGWLLISPIEPSALLPFAAAALALAAGLGAASFEVDLPGERFGWKQVAAGIAGVSLALACLPVLLGVHDGRWGAPERSHADVLSWFEEAAAEGPFRVLWVGSPDALPSAGWFLDDGMAFATSRSGAPTVSEVWSGPRRSADDVLAGALADARQGRTADLGRLVAPLGVRYVVVPLQAAPGSEVPDRAVPEDLPIALRAQVDLRERDTNRALLVFENDAWAPVRSQIPVAAGDLAAEGSAAAAAEVDLRGVPSVLAPTRPGSLRFRGDIGAGDVLVAEASSPRWTLRVAGAPARRATAFDNVMVFRSDRGGPATLRFRTPLSHLAGVGVQVLLLALAAASVARGRSGRPATAAPGPSAAPDGGPQAPPPPADGPAVTILGGPPPAEAGPRGSGGPAAEVTWPTDETAGPDPGDPDGDDGGDAVRPPWPAPPAAPPDGGGLAPAERPAGPSGRGEP